MKMNRLCVLGALVISQVLLLQATPSMAANVAERVREYRTAHEIEIVTELAELVALPNPASDLPAMERNAAHLTGSLERRGFSVSLLRAEGAPPVIYGHRSNPKATRTVIFYAHYDGQPVVPELWHSDPWQVLIRTGRVEDGATEVPLEDLETPLDPEWRLYGRSASDDKVSIVALLTALDALDTAGIAPTVDIKLVLDGEEERGSPHVAEILRANRELLEADLWVFCDGPMHQNRLPQVVYGVRGVTSVHMTAYGPAVGLHSGHYGNWAPDPGMQLVNLISTMRDDEGNITVAGIDGLVRRPGATEAAAIEEAPPVDEKLRADLDLGWTEGAPTPLAERIMRPAINLLGFSVGAVGDRAKNAISPEARAVVGFRLVPDVTPEAIRDAVEAHIRVRGHHIVYDEPDAAVRSANKRLLRLQWKMGYPALWTDMDLPISKDVARIVDEAVDGPVVLAPTMGGSLPLIVFSEILGGPPIVVVPIANHDNNQHAPNENLRLGNLWQGMEIYGALMARMGESGS